VERGQRQVGGGTEDEVGEDRGHGGKSRAGGGEAALTAQTGDRAGYADKLRAVNLGRLEIKDAVLSDVLDFLRKAAADSPQEFQVNIVNTIGGESGSVKVSLLLNSVSVYDAIRYVARIAGVQCEFEENAVVFSPPKPVTAPARG
jgi:hypothetical protein